MRYPGTESQDHWIKKANLRKHREIGILQADPLADPSSRPPPGGGQADSLRPLSGPDSFARGLTIHPEYPMWILLIATATWFR